MVFQVQGKAGVSLSVLGSATLCALAIVPAVWAFLRRVPPWSMPSCEPVKQLLKHMFQVNSQGGGVLEVDARIEGVE